MIDAIFGEHKIPKTSQDLSEIMGDHLIRLSELLIQNNKIPNEMFIKCVIRSQQIYHKLHRYRQIT
jgi:hypothetical protein